LRAETMLSPACATLSERKPGFKGMRTLASAAPWTPVAASRLHVTSGTVTTLASGLLQTRSPQMRAVERDNGRHARWGRLRFRYVQPSDGTSTLGSGALRRQLGLKLQAGDSFNPEIAILDIGMPGATGYEVARAMRERRGNAVTLVALTGWGQEADRQRATEAGFDYHLTKPVDPSLLNDLLVEVALRAGSTSRQT